MQKPILTHHNAALTVAAEKRDFDCVKILIQAGADVNEFNRYNKSPLMCAVEKDNSEFPLHLLQSGADVNLSNDIGWTALIKAANCGVIQCVTTLLEKGSDVNHQTINNDTALSYALKHKYEDCGKALIEAGANVNQVYSPDKESPLIIAASKACNKSIKSLVRAGADVNLRNIKGQTALMIATTEGNVRSLQLLLKAGAGVKNKAELATALENADHNRHLKCLQLLINVGVDVSMVNPRTGRRALMDCCRDGYFRSVNEITKARADVNIVGRFRKTALNYTSIGQDPLCNLCLTLLLKAGANVNKIDMYGMNALQSHIVDSEVGKEADKERAMLLFAAGEKLTGTTVPYLSKTSYGHNLIHCPVPDYLLNKELKSCLKHLCREAIRTHQVDLPHQNLFQRVPQLDLPSILADYLLHDMSLDIEEHDIDAEECDDVDNEGSSSESSSEYDSRSENDDDNDDDENGDDDNDDENFNDADEDENNDDYSKGDD